MSLDSSSGSTGITIIVGGCIAVASVITLTTGCYTHWVPVIAGIVVGLWAVRSISK